MGAGLGMDVGTFTRSIRIGRPIDEVWSVLADIGSILETNLPFSRADICFTLLEVDDGTEVAVPSDYSLRFGPVGRIMDAVMVRRTCARGMEGLLAGLQRHMEDPDA